MVNLHIAKDLDEFPMVKWLEESLAQQELEDPGLLPAFSNMFLGEVAEKK